MKKLSLSGYVLPITVLAFTAVGVQYVGAIFTDTTRWALMLALLAVLIARGQVHSAFQNKAGVTLLLYFAWCVATVLWSEVPLLSFYKSVALCMTATAAIGGGYIWATHWQPEAPLRFLLPIVALAIFAGSSERGGVNVGTIRIYQGLSGNPNYLGSLIAMAFPLVVWQIYKNKKIKTWYVAWIGVAATLIGELYLTASRSSILAVLITASAFLVVLNTSRKYLYLGLSGALLLGTLVAVPAVQDAISERFMFKGNITDGGDIFFSRRDIWADSFARGIDGGLTGAGYGVSIGYTEFAGGLTAVGYGREKGNTQAAVMEETGIIGLGIYIVLLVLIIFDLSRGIRMTPDPDRKVQLGLLLGAIVGFTVMSCFEAWWVAPGSPESVYFWAIVGAAYGVVKISVPARQRQRSVAASDFSAAPAGSHT